MTPYPYEIHITVQSVPNGNAFKRWCEELGVKPIMLALQSQSNGMLTDVMTSSVVVGTLEDAHIESRRIESGLRVHGLCTMRRKIETVPWNPMITETVAGPSNYFESHIAISVKKYSNKLPADTKSKLAEVCHSLDLHLSANQFKNDAESVVYMATLRQFGTTYDDFKDRTNAAIESLEINMYNVIKSVTEYAVWDSNVDHDSAWMT